MTSARSVDVLIVSFNTRDVLRAALSSLFDRPPAGDLEVTVSVLDNASTDGSVEMVAEEFPSVRLIRSAENLGFGAANNRLASTSEADYVLLANSDVIFVEDIVTPLVRALEDSNSTVAAGPRLMYPDGQVQYSAQGFPTISYEFAEVLRGTRLGRALSPIFDSSGRVEAVRQQGLTDKRVPREPDFLWATCWMVRRRDVRTYGLFDPGFPMYDEDLDFCRRMRNRGLTVRYVPSTALVHIGGVSSETSHSKRRLMTTARRAYYRRHHGWLSEFTYAHLVPLVAVLVTWVAKVPLRLVRLDRRP